MEPRPPSATSVDDPARVQLGGFGVGFRRPLFGLQWLMENRGSWPLALMPMLIFSTLALVAIWFSPDLADLILGWIWSEPRGQSFWVTWILHPLWTFCWWVFLLLSAALGIVASLVLSVPLSGPFLELLCERHEESCTGEDVPFAWKAALLNPLVSLAHVSLLLAMELVLVVFSLLVGLIPVVGPPLSAVISMVVSVVILGLGLLDYPMTLRLWSLPEKFRFASQGGREFVGFALCCFLLMYIPVLNLFLIPACVLGANQMVIDWEAEDRIEWEDRRRLTRKG